MATYKDDVTFTITCTMRQRWVPHFLAMLRYIQWLGSAGSTRRVSIIADGDGDFRPKFSWNDKLPSDGKPIDERGGNNVYDAG